MGQLSGGREREGEGAPFRASPTAHLARHWQDAAVHQIHERRLPRAVGPHDGNCDEWDRDTLQPRAVGTHFSQGRIHEWHQPGTPTWSTNLAGVAHARVVSGGWVRVPLLSPRESIERSNERESKMVARSGKWKRTS